MILAQKFSQPIKNTIEAQWDTFICAERHSFKEYTKYAFSYIKPCCWANFQVSSVFITCHGGSALHLELLGSFVCLTKPLIFARSILETTDGKKQIMFILCFLIKYTSITEHEKLPYYEQISKGEKKCLFLLISTQDKPFLWCFMYKGALV